MDVHAPPPSLSCSFRRQERNEKRGGENEISGKREKEREKERGDERKETPIFYWMDSRREGFSRRGGDSSYGLSWVYVHLNLMMLFI